MHPSVVSVERTISAPAAAIFDVLADPRQHPVIDGSGTVQAVRDGAAARLSRGAEFGMSMKNGAAYKITNRVVEFEEGRLIAWRHFAGHRWRYTLTPVAGGTHVREEWDPSRLRWVVRIAYRLVGYPERNRKGMVATLARLEEHLGATRTSSS